MEIKFDVRPKGNNITLVVLRGEIGVDTVSHFKDKLDAIVNEGKKRLIEEFDENFVKIAMEEIASGALEIEIKDKEK